MMTKSISLSKLSDKYLPEADVYSTQSVTIHAPVHVVFPILQNLQFRKSKLIYWLFKLRGIPVPESLSLQGLEKLSFVRLEEIPDRGIIIGLIGRFWTPTGQLISFKPEEYVSFRSDYYAKGTWSFELTVIEENKTLLVTETRVHCPTDKSRRNFKRYWTFIRPFSTLIRKEILKSVKRDAEDAYQKTLT